MISPAPKPPRRDVRYCLPDPAAVPTDKIIMSHVPRGSRVLDLGCGDGRLLATLRDEHQSLVQGVELDFAAIKQAASRGVPVIQGDLDQGLEIFPEGAFDFAILSQTLQQVRRPRLILKEMLRVARRALVVFPNFGHWRVRWQVVRHGRAPVTSALPYEWYNTPNLHFLSLPDMRDLIELIGARIVQELPIINGRPLNRPWLANLRADSALFVLERRENPN